MKENADRIEHIAYYDIINTVGVLKNRLSGLRNDDEIKLMVETLSNGAVHFHLYVEVNNDKEQRKHRIITITDVQREVKQ